MLPATPVLHAWAEPGLDKPCDACDSLIERDDTEFELAFGTARLWFHVGCHLVWREERDRRPKGFAVDVLTSHPDR
jgi:hypothetical protein